jgi:hypothetical protein
VERFHNAIFRILADPERLTIDSRQTRLFNSATKVMCTWGKHRDERPPAWPLGFSLAFSTGRRVGDRPHSGKETGFAWVVLFGS